MEQNDLPFMIGTGPGRTGTASLCTALNQLGYKTYHMKEIVLGKAEATTWFDLAKAERAGETTKVHELATKAANTLIEEGYTATVDFPSIFVYKELLEAKPDAKIILSVRTNGNAWSKSVLSTIGRMGPILHNKRPFMYSNFWSRFAADLHPWIFESMGVANFGELDTAAVLDKDSLSNAHDEWIEHIKATVPKEQLLLHKSADGFEPICKHLGISDDKCPSEYPYVNDSTQMQIMLGGLVALNIAFWPLVLFFVLFFLRSIVIRSKYGPPRPQTKSIPPAIREKKRSSREKKRSSRSKAKCV